ncbi:hypothetical protein FCH28_07425 [Streptomyces piniterrae]|uniref:Uncharacterized protein n=1 Tax=Streptomyces piniterrae TaxID=2571125 RepID=A0A4V5MNG4_9ACTN|nr:hypothetical protein [Streptomyces piniterrae]TJZ57258.1 hypothetical protein FCH28_07425 [Streptomyces piniterrae]
MIKRSGTRGAANNDALLRFALKLDGTVSGLVAALSLLGARALDPLLGLPSWLHWAQGGFLAVYAAGLWYAGTRPAVIRWIAAGAVVLNAIWAVGCIAIIAAGPAWFPITVLGDAYVGLIGLAVMVFGAMQYAGLGRAR